MSKPLVSVNKAEDINACMSDGLLCPSIRGNWYKASVGNNKNGDETDGLLIPVYDSLFFNS